MGRCSAFGERQNCRGIELARNAAHGTTDGVGNRAGQVCVGGTLGIVALDATGDGCHRFDCLHRVVTDRGLIGQHHRIGSIQNRVGHVTHFRAGGAGTGSHRIEHLGGRDDRNAQAVGLVDQILLQQGNVLGGHLHTEIAAGHHHTVTQGKDGVDLIDGFEFFDLCHHRSGEAMLADQFTNLLHVGGIAHEAQGNPIHTLLKSERQILTIFSGECSHRQLNVREIHSLVVGENATHGDDAVKGLINFVDAVHFHLDTAVVQKNAASSGDLLGQFVVGDRRHGLVATHLLGGQRKVVAFTERDRPFFKAAQANLWSLKILKDADVNTQLVSHLSDGGDSCGVFAVIAVGKIQSERCGTRLDQFPNAFGTFSGWADRGDDLGSTGQIELGHPWRHKPAESTVMTSTVI